VIVASTLTTNLAVLVLAGFIGFAVISRVPNTLHTPLMSGTNAIHGIVLLGGLLVVGLAGNSTFNKIILVIAITFGTINIVGGFLVTDRMLEMFKSKPKPAADSGGGDGTKGAGAQAPTEQHPTPPHAGAQEATEQHARRPDAEAR
jgi:H+-translocating NAD(P) transhydrogenase subunit alpha